MSERKFIKFRAVRVRQPIGEFFIGSVPSSELIHVVYADVRRLEQRDVERYLGIQRPLNPERVKELAAYVRTADATFPTAIIVAAPSVCAEWDEPTGMLTLSEYIDPEFPERSYEFNRIAKILDGQHRLAGLENYKGPPFDVNVAIFVDLDIPEQASIFSVVNLTQTKVNRSLAYDLYSLARARSPQKTAHSIAVALDSTEGSPFYRRIKRLGRATSGRTGELLTQATIVESILPYITTDAMGDRDKLRRKLRLKRADEVEAKKLIFRNLFIDGKDDEIAKIIWGYFDAVSRKWSAAWVSTEQGNILSKTNGFRALMRFLRPAYLNLADKPGEYVSSDRFVQVFQRVKIQDADFTIENFPPGTSGESKLFKQLAQDSKLTDG